MQDERDSYYARVRHYSAERVAPFNAANLRSPKARDTERRLLIDRLSLQPGMVVLDTGSGGGYLVDGFPLFAMETGTIICTDTAEHFMRSIPQPFLPIVCGMDAIGLASESVHRISNLAGLHHVQRKAAFFSEAYRVLKPGGVLAVADVKRGTKPALWLNGPVDRMTDIGHDGMFLEAGEFSDLMAGSGFTDLQESHELYTWSFEDWPELVSFVRDLFRLTRATRDEIERAVPEFLGVHHGPTSVELEWELTFATGRKPGESNVLVGAERV